jgi:hypothetical protein
MNAMTIDFGSAPSEDIERARQIIEALNREFQPLAETLTGEAEPALLFRPTQVVEP